MLRTILIDDEPKARENLRILLQKYCSGDIQIVAECDNVKSAYTTIIALNPELIFLDIELGKGTGFDLLKDLTQHSFKVIFVTAYDHYAIKAIKFSALDYLLKPVALNDLINAVNKAKQSVVPNSDAQYQSLFEYIKKPNHKSNRIAIAVADGYQLIPVDQIVYCQSNREYTVIHCSDGQLIHSSQNIGEYEELLVDYDFFRVHNSYIINRQFIQRYIRGESGNVLLNNKETIPISRRKKNEFLQWLIYQK